MVVLAIIVAGFLIPERIVIPVAGATVSDWNIDTFWYEPWGASGAHKGVDIFATRDTAVVAATGGIVMFSGTLKRGGNVALVLGPKWRVHYYAHLASIATDGGRFLSRGDAVGTVGATGNAAGKQPHLHYVILTLIPYPWRVDKSTQGWKKMFYLDPGLKLTVP
jgi:murein DD-endopeptidase MepM/ murein hydrolase activator NlpD